MKDFKSYLLPQVQSFCEGLEKYELTVAIIGGTVRDYLLGLKSKHDYDIEIRPKEDLRPENLNKIILLIKTDLEKEYDVELLPFSILKIKLDKCSVEITFPREEFFKDEFSHSNFDMRLFSDLDYSGGVLRRDFTINSILAVLSDGHWNLIDPLDGIRAIKDKKLIPCSEDFYRDPVRFLRALRFSILLDFEMDEKICAHFSTLNINDFSAHYLRLESIKSKSPIIFMLKLYEFLNHGDFKKEISEMHLVDKGILNLKKHLMSLIHLNPELKESLVESLDYSIKPNLYNLPLSIKEIREKSLDAFIKEANQFELISLFKDLFQLEEKYINFLESKEYIDISFNDLKKMKETFVDLSSIENDKKKHYQLYERLKMLD